MLAMDKWLMWPSLSKEGQVVESWDHREREGNQDLLEGVDHRGWGGHWDRQKKVEREEGLDQQEYKVQQVYRLLLPDSLQKNYSHKCVCVLGGGGTLLPSEMLRGGGQVNEFIIFLWSWLCPTLFLSQILDMPLNLKTS
jgi:hypothetical protein